MVVDLEIIRITFVWHRTDMFSAARWQRIEQCRQDKLGAELTKDRHLEAFGWRLQRIM